ncbi:methyl-accepting chemotaxis protein PctA [Bowmanella denitrificans]|uniref:Methyl-accepting chemotaxis protein PctA n=1 Tax=Bowmanella denitrificans TaxID=366582 RepID=A0ABN0XMQ6_9ALTE
MAKPLTFTSKISLAASCILVAVLGAFTLNNYFVMRAHTEAQVEQSLKDNSSAAASNIATWLNGKLALVSSIADEYQPSDGRDLLLRNVQSRAQAGNFKNTYIGEKSGTFTLDDQSIALPADYNATLRPWYQLAEKTRSPAFTTPYIDATTGDLTITAVVPIVRQGKLLGVAGGDIDMLSIANQIKSIDFSGYGYAFLVDAQGKILSHPQKSLNDQHIQQVFGQSLAIQPAYFEHRTDQQELLVLLTPVEGLENVNWYLVGLVDKQQAYAALQAFRNRAIVYMLIGIAAIALMMSLLLKYLMQPLKKLTNAIEDIAAGEGDLTRRLHIQREDEFGMLSKDFNAVIDKLHQSFIQVKIASDALQQSVQSLLTHTHSSMSMQEQQTGYVEHAVQTIQYLADSASGIADSTTQATSLTQDAKQKSQLSNNALGSNIQAIQSLSGKMHQAQQAVDSLEQHTTSINQVLEVIEGVSEQTNLLALNAAIEAARAGDAGRGFAVVADEVRQLAQRTQESTQQIQRTISQLQDGASGVVSIMKTSIEDCEQSVSLVSQAGDRVEDVNQAIQSLESVNIQVANATGQQNQLITQLNDTIVQVNSLSEQGNANLKATLKECNNLNMQFGNLEKMLARFKV